MVEETRAVFPLVAEVVDEIDEAIAAGHKDTAAVFGWVRAEGYPRNALYLAVYTRLLDAGYSAEFDFEAFGELPLIPDGAVGRGEA
jgi:hypothetical protein